MHKRQKGYARAFRRVQDFLDQHAGELGPINETGARKRLDRIVDSIAELEHEQDPMMLARTADLERERRLVGELRLFHMRPIATIARAHVAQFPALERLRMPRGNADLYTVVLTAHEMANGAAEHAELFVTTGLPEDFAERLHAAADAVSVAALTRYGARARRIGATAALASEVKTGAALLAILDALIAPSLAAAPDLRAGWQATRRIAARRAARGTSNDAESPATPMLVAPAPTQAAA